MKESLKEYVQQITQLPTIPVVAQEIMSLINNELTSVNRLENIIENDPPIAAKIIGVANSAFFGYKTPAQSVNNAIMRIGFNNVRDIALGVSLMTVFETKKEASVMDYQRIFNHSVTVGLVAQLISRDLKMRFADEIFMNGILHDLGYLIMNRFFSDIFRKVTDAFGTGGSLLDAEKKVFEFTHADIGVWLAAKWNLPEGILDTILYHHNPSLAEKHNRRTAIIHLADYIVSKGVFSPIQGDPRYPLDLSILDVLEVKEDYLAGIQDRISSGDIY